MSPDSPILPYRVPEYTVRFESAPWDPTNRMRVTLVDGDGRDVGFVMVSRDFLRSLLPFAAGR